MTLWLIQTSNVRISSPMGGGGGASRYFLEQETLPSLLSTHHSGRVEGCVYKLIASVRGVMA